MNCVIGASPQCHHRDPPNQVTRLKGGTKILSCPLFTYLFINILFFKRRTNIKINTRQFLIQVFTRTFETNHVKKNRIPKPKRKEEESEALKG